MVGGQYHVLHKLEGAERESEGTTSFSPQTCVNDTAAASRSLTARGREGSEWKLPVLRGPEGHQVQDVSVFLRPSRAFREPGAPVLHPRSRCVWTSLLPSAPLVRRRPRPTPAPRAWTRHISPAWAHSAVIVPSSTTVSVLNAHWSAGSGFSPSAGSSTFSAESAACSRVRAWPSAAGLLPAQFQSIRWRISTLSAPDKSTRASRACAARSRR